ncbi:hypothetical protein HY345_01785 [Candidatus Microgenomates bacterium]|nr:hypothetical protein [Candidatus Microgenomates bacterium]
MSKLSPSKRKELMVALCRALATLNKPKEVAEFLLDFLSPKENEMVAKRLRIAELLTQGWNYGSIKNEVGVGNSTIAKVGTWLNLSGKGLRLVLQRKTKEQKEVSPDEKYDPLSWYSYKHRYTLQFWPELLLEELIKQTNEIEKNKIKTIFEKLDIKRRSFSKEANKKLYDQFKEKLE